MQSTDWMILFMTFITGVAAGSFIYFNGFAEIDVDPNPAITPYEEVADFEVTVSEYGGCARGGTCSSYKLNDDGSYTLIPRGGSPVTGFIINRELRDIKKAAAEFDFVTQSQPVEMDDCFSYLDGIDVAYGVSYDGVEYQLDTCGTAVDVDDEFIELLDELMFSLLDS